MKEIIIVIASVAATLCLAAMPRDGVYVNCSLVEFHPDLVKYRDACRGAR